MYLSCAIILLTSDFHHNYVVVFLFYRCHQLQKILNEDGYLKQVWSAALVWLQTEMDRVSTVRVRNFAAINFRVFSKICAWKILEGFYFRVCIFVFAMKMMRNGGRIINIRVLNFRGQRLSSKNAKINPAPSKFRTLTVVMLLTVQILLLLSCLPLTETVHWYWVQLLQLVPTCSIQWGVQWLLPGAL